MTARRTARIAAVVALVAGALVVTVAGTAGAAPGVAPRVAPAPPFPAPTAAHPFQGLRRLTVATIPPVPGARFSVDGREFVADGAGIATTLVTKDQRFAVRVARDQHLRVDSPVVTPSPGVRARFAGWSGPGEYRGGAIPEEYQRATFNIDYLTSFAFVTPRGEAVNPRTLDAMHLRSSTGARVVLHRMGPVWLSGSLAATGHNGLQVRSVSYAIDDVTTAGAAVVHRAQQRFFPSRRQVVRIPLLLFRVTFVPGDALFGGSAGSAISLEYPDGSTRRFPVRSDGTVTVARLARGTYHATVTGAGPRTAQELTVSTSSRLDLQVWTWLDTALIVGLALILLISLLLAGRYVRRRGRRRVEVDVAADEREEAAEAEMVGVP